MNRAEYMRGYRQKGGVTDKRNTCVVCRGSFIARRGAKTCSPGCKQKSYRERVTDKRNTAAVTLPVNNVTPAVNTPALAWRYRMADNYATGTLINKAGSIDRTSVEVSLRERFGRAVMELEPCV